MECAKALRRLTDRVEELRTDELFTEPLNGIQAWISQAALGTSLAEAQAKIDETETIVGFPYMGIRKSLIYLNPMPCFCLRTPYGDFHNNLFEERCCAVHGSIYLGFKIKTRR